MRLLGPNTIGLVNLTDRIPLSASGVLEMDEFPTGSIGVVSQSGGILGSLLSRAAGRGVGLSKLISTGNEVDLKLGDFVDFLVDDPATNVIALYIESIRDAERFRAAALKAAAAGKPIVAYKIGRSEAGATAAASHTGAMAGSDKVYDAFFQQIGVIRARNVLRPARHSVDDRQGAQAPRQSSSDPHIDRGRGNARLRQPRPPWLRDAPSGRCDSRAVARLAAGRSGRSRSQPHRRDAGRSSGQRSCVAQSKHFWRARHTMRSRSSSARPASAIPI